MEILLLANRISGKSNKCYQTKTDHLNKVGYDIRMCSVRSLHPFLVHQSDYIDLNDAISNWGIVVCQQYSSSQGSLGLGPIFVALTLYQLWIALSRPIINHMTAHNFCYLFCFVWSLQHEIFRLQLCCLSVVCQSHTVPSIVANDQGVLTHKKAMLYTSGLPLFICLVLISTSLKRLDSPSLQMPLYCLDLKLSALISFNLLRTALTVSMHFKEIVQKSWCYG